MSIHISHSHIPFKTHPQKKVYASPLCYVKLSVVLSPKTEDPTVHRSNLLWVCQEVYLSLVMITMEYSPRDLWLRKTTNGERLLRITVTGSHSK